MTEYLTNLGYSIIDDYNFEEKKLRARAFINKENEFIPRVFVSEPKLEEFSDAARYFANFIGRQYQIYKGPFLGRPSSSPLLRMPFDIYNKISEESEYMGWVLVNGLIPNHFTISLDDLDMEEVLGIVSWKGYILNDFGHSYIKKAENLWQASTLAEPRPTYFWPEKKFRVCTCFYEFSKRFNGFDGFVPENADKIFESTNRRCSF